MEIFKFRTVIEMMKGKNHGIFEYLTMKLKYTHDNVTN